MIDVRKVFNKKYLIFFTADMSRFSLPMHPLIKTSSWAIYPSRPFSFQYTCLSAKSGWILGNMGRKVKGEVLSLPPLDNYFDFRYGSHTETGVEG